jgi:ceramide kinase
MYRIVLHTFRKTESDSCKWVPKAFVFGHSNAKDAQEWVQKSQNLLDHDTRRPKRLLVCVLFDFVYHSFDKMSKNS